MWTWARVVASGDWLGAIGLLGTALFVDRAIHQQANAAELATLDSDPVVVESHDIAELDRRWTRVEEGASMLSHDRVVRWLRTWGTLRFRPYQDE